MLRKKLIPRYTFPGGRSDIDYGPSRSDGQNEDIKAGQLHIRDRWLEKQRRKKKKKKKR